MPPDARGRFFNFYAHDLVRAAVCVPEVRIADPAYNAARTTALLRRAAENHALIALFPELGLSAYSCEDLFQQQVVLDGCRDALAEVLDSSRELPVIGVVGVPLQMEAQLFNCAVVFHRGRLLGVVPKTYLPNYREFYELRQFAPGDRARAREIELCGQHEVPFGTRLLFQVQEQPLCTFHVEICEDLWTPIPPSSYAALAGANLLLNLSASNVTVAKDDYRRALVANQSARCLAGYVYCAAGNGESTTDLAWDGHGMIYEDGTRIAESERFAPGAQFFTGEIDLGRITQDRMRQNTFGESVERHRDVLGGFRTVRFSAELPAADTLLPQRRWARFPFVPGDPARRDERCREVYEIQVHGLVQRLRATGIDRVVIGISGGLDSTQALLVCARAFDLMNLPRGNILAYTLPGFATGSRTLDQARRLMRVAGCTAGEIDIRPSCRQMLEDIDHPFARGEKVYDVTFQNVQAGERTSHLFRIANLQRGLVVGTSDLSELALGWATYGVGDHMAHYHLNASVPKTLVRYLIRWVARTNQLGAETSEVLDGVLDTVISPELVPGERDGQPEERSEDTVGPYELQDFNLYHVLRFGFSPSKVAFLAWCAWRERTAGTWPGVPEAERNQYTVAEIRRWLAVFLKRFFQDSQFKRSCIANAPKVGSGGSLSPRGDWRAPSDATAAAWLKALEAIPVQEPD